MSNNINEKVLLVGSGFMAREYLLVLGGLGVEAIVVGRSAAKIEALKKDFPKFEFHADGLDKYLKNNKDKTSIAINAASIGQLKETTLLLLDAGIKRVLLEKPGALNLADLHAIGTAAKEMNAKVVIAYNRRFYAALDTLCNEAAIDGGITSVHFEFTEWVHRIFPEDYDKNALTKWIISNSSHVIDTVFALIGLPEQLNAIVKGKDVLDWHPSGTVFVGSGLSNQGIPFTYHSNWESAGRWAIEVSTRARRFYLRPMERLQQQLKGSVQLTDCAIDDTLDIQFKPGLYAQTKSFLTGDYERMMSIDEQIAMLPVFYSIGGYEEIE